MKQYTTPEQTAKLIKLGFAKPKSIGGYRPTFVVEYEGVEISNVIIGENKQEPIYAYSIGELIEMLPDEIYVDETIYSKVINKTDVCYYSWPLEVYAISIYDAQEELIDNLYDMILKLKEEKII